VHISKNAKQDEAKEEKKMKDIISKLGIDIAHWIRDKDEIVKPSAHTLHFQGDSKQKTMVGGISSMSVTAYLLFMVYTNGSKLIGKDDNQITSLME
jgi:predicted XRE-type DNA-binding protein